MNKKRIFIWSLYDFANSIVMIAFFLYFSQWLVIDRGISDFWFNLTLTISGILYLAIGPILGSIADKSGDKTTGIRVTTLVSGSLYLITGLIAVLRPDMELLASVFFIGATSTYLLSFIYYNSFLKDLAPQEKQGLVSGWGLVGNYLGQISAILIALPFATGTLTLFGEPGRAQAFIPATLLFLLLSLPLLITFKHIKPPNPVSISISHEYKNFWKSFRGLLRIPNLGRFLIAYFFFNDAVLTSANNFPIYMERVFGTSDSTKSYVLLGIMVTSAIGCPLSGWIADRIGFKKTLVGILAGWIIIFPLLSIANSVAFVVVVTVFMGILFGGAWTVTRAMIVRLTPHGSLNQSLTYFVLVERLATLMGPVSWGLIVALGPTANALNYRLAALAMTVFIVAGLIVAKKLPDDAL